MEGGLFVTFEGIEASGKSVQSKRLIRSLDQMGIPCWLTKEPGGTELGVELRRILKYSEEEISQLTEVFLFAADRLHHVPVIRRSLEAGRHVISDRYSDSTRAYQCYGRATGSWDYDGTLGYIKVSESGLVPDVTYYLAVPVEVAVERMKNSPAHTSRFDKEMPEFHARVAHGYEVIAAAEPERFVVIDGTLPEEEIAEFILGDFLDRLEGR